MSKPSVRLWSNLTAQRVFASLKITSPLSAFICQVFISEFNFRRVLSPFLLSGLQRGHHMVDSTLAHRFHKVLVKCKSACVTVPTAVPGTKQYSKAYQVPLGTRCIYWTPTVLGTFLRYIRSFIFTSIYRPATMYQDLPDTRNIKIHMTLSCSL